MKNSIKGLNSIKSVALWTRYKFFHPSPPATSDAYSPIRRKTTVVRSGNNKLLGVIQKEDWHPNPSIKYVFYPLPKYIGAFAKSGKERKGLGPALSNPGGVGTIEIKRRTQWQAPELPDYEIDVAQSHYKKGSPKELTTGISTIYGGWVRHTAKQIFRDLKHGETIALNTKPKPHGALKPSVIAAFEEMAKEAGLQVKQLDDGILITKL